jgi:hypothetical protein
MAKITGIGGVFFKSQKDLKALAAWYEKNLGMPIEAWGGAILRGGGDQSARGLGTVWRVTEKDIYFYDPSHTFDAISNMVQSFSLLFDEQTILE